MRNNRGVTLITVAIAVIVMLIILATILFNARNTTSSQKIDNMYNDLNIVKDKVNIYYWKYGSLPIKEEYTQISQIPSNVLNPNDSGKYYVIDLNSLENLSLNSNNAGQNIYVINETTHTIYFPSGVEVEGITYYRLPEEYTKIEF